MIYPRFLAQFLAWLGGYFWLPCPICKEPFAGFEASLGGECAITEDADGEHMWCVCRKPSCLAQGERNRMEYFQKRWANATSTTRDR